MLGRVLAIVLLASSPALAGTAPIPLPLSRQLRALDRMMSSLAHESARGALAIRDAYDEHLELLYLEEYEAMAGALATGGLVPLPLDPRFNLMPRRQGAHPIGEKDLERQESYIAARPFTVGCLVEIASRVKSGPIEITSLVRHGEYQDALLQTNTNARTAVPTHTMGLAFDIALINTPLETVYEIRDVLRQMRDAGDLLFIGERRQLVFHVVPHPSKLGHFVDVYTAALGAPGGVQAVQVVAPAPAPEAGVISAAAAPRVTAEVVALSPADVAHVPAWRQAMGGPEPAAAAPSVPPAPPVPPAPSLRSGDVMFGGVLMSTGLFAVFVAIAVVPKRPRSPVEGLLHSHPTCSASGASPPRA